MMRISLESPALTAVRSWLDGSAAQSGQRSGRSGHRKASRLRFHAERLEPRTMLDAGMRAFLPDLVEASDTGPSNVDDVTHDRTPTLTGSVRGGVSQVRLFINGQPGDLLPVTNGSWTHTVPAEAALAAGRHRIAVRPLDASNRVGKLSRPLNVTIASGINGVGGTNQQPFDAGTLLTTTGAVPNTIQLSQTGGNGAWIPYFRIGAI